MEKIIFVVVLYKTHPQHSATLVSLSQHSYAEFYIDPIFVVWDNSSHGFGESSLDFMPGRVKYYHSGLNEKLSSAYNKVVLDSSDMDWYVFLDDDSCVDESYLISLKSFFTSGVPVAVPKILHNGVIISPGAVRGVKGKLLPEFSLYTGVRSSKQLVAMMSGTVVSSSVFGSGVYFDERLQLYGVDTRFFIDYSNVYSKIYVLDVVMTHHSALRDESMPVEEQVVRHRRLAAAWPIIFDGVRFYRLKLFFYILYYSLKLSLVRRSPRFLLVALSVSSLFKR